MSIGRYLALKCAVGFAVFLITCPLAFLLTGLIGGFFPKAGVMLAFGIVGLAYIVTSLFLTHTITEKLSKRWSR